MLAWGDASSANIMAVMTSWYCGLGATARNRFIGLVEEDMALAQKQGPGLWQGEGGKGYREASNLGLIPRRQYLSLMPVYSESKSLLDPLSGWIILSGVSFSACGMDPNADVGRYKDDL